MTLDEATKAFSAKALQTPELAGYPQLDRIPVRDGHRDKQRYGARGPLCS